MTSTGLLVLSNVKQIGQSLQYVGKYVQTLFVHLNIPVSAVQPTRAPAWRKIISQLYIDSSKYHLDGGNGYGNVGANFDLRVLVGPLKGQSVSRTVKRPIEMLFSDCHCPELCETLRRELNIPAETIYLQSEQDPTANIADNSFGNAATKDGNDEQLHKMYETVVLGGTFDRIHLGHKIFLTQAVLRTGRRLVVGVTTAKMTTSKTLWELILPVEQRMERVLEFLKEIDDSVEYDVVPIDDPFGPTRTDPCMDMIMVSEETLRGGHKVNELRANNNLRQLEIVSVEMVENNDMNGPKETKVSSSNTRIDLLGTRLRKPEPRPNLPKNPYIIGLTGAIAAGKSKMSQRFRDMGAVIMDGDKVAHEIYEPGEVCYEKIIERFGRGILDEENGRINRKKLASIVFGSKKELAALDAIVWPELMLEVKRRIQLIPKTVAGTTQVVFIEAAVLLQAGWETECHEVWSMIVPPELAVQRVMARNGLSEDEARKRMTSQMTNSEIVAKSNVIFSSQWDADFTQKQAERAWQMLQRELKEHNQAQCNSNL